VTIDETLLAKVGEFVDDPEVAHIMEDDLRHRVLEHIANWDKTSKDITWYDVSDMVELAKIALLTEHMEFPRWCA
jgi:hypothetical protein